MDEMHRIEKRDGMIVEWDAPIPADDGLVLRADIFRPDSDGAFPAILTYGPYGKGLAFQDGNASAWRRMTEGFPDTAAGSSNVYQNWEVSDPEKWVPDGYVLIRVDSRGAGRSPGFLDPWSPRETRDVCDCIEWAAVQPWSTGKVGMNGISYYAMNQWYAAALQPPHLAAICVWEGAADYYREVSRHGGIYCQFFENLYPRALLRVQHGLGDRGLRSRVTGELVSGPETLADEELAANRIAVDRWILDRPLDGPDYRERSPVWDNVKVPVLSAANWGGQGLHTRGNFEGFLECASEHKWLEVHGEAHWVHFYTDYGIALQKRFFGQFLKGESTGWEEQLKVLLQVRHVDGFAPRSEQEWPLARTQWTKFYLHPNSLRLSPQEPAPGGPLTYEAMGKNPLFLTEPFVTETEITGPVAVKLFLSSSTRDADIFLALRVFDPEGTEVVFHGSNDPRTPVGLGWLRASHRKLDPTRTKPYRPFHTHDDAQALTPDVPVELDVEIWPTSIVIPVGYRLGLAVRGKDYHCDGPPLAIPGVKYTLTGVGPFLHERAEDRPPSIFGGEHTLHFEPGKLPYVLLPIIPPRTEAHV
jgi:predicted acyl esterase